VTLEDAAEKGFATDQNDVADATDLGAESTGVGTPDALVAEPPEAAAVVVEPAEDAVVVAHTADLSVLDMRPSPGRPRQYHFPRFERFTLSNGLTVVHADLPGRALLAAQLLLPFGAWNEPAGLAGVTVLAGRAMPEGTRRRDANEFVEAAERLGAEIHADATWETVSASVEVPKSHFAPALALLSEMVAEPAFPADEVDRLRDERLNDLMQAWADPRRRAERVFPETIYAAETPYSRPLGGVRETVERLDRDAVAERHRQLLNPAGATLVVAGDLSGIDIAAVAEVHLGGLASAASAETSRADAGARDVQASASRRIVLVDRPGAAQSEVRIGHVGVARRNPDFHTLSVLNAILGGTFNSRLNRVIREELGYTYGIGSSFDMRRGAGPFVIRTAVETAVTVPAVLEILRIVSDFRDAEVESDELSVARDYLIGVFPLRFEAAAQVAAALGGLIVFGLPDDELDRYRPQVAAVTARDVMSAANRYIKPEELSVVIVGDASQIELSLRDAGLGEITFVAADAADAADAAAG
jgi:predicted Zn-dependent peptidase